MSVPGKRNGSILVVIAGRAQYKATVGDDNGNAVKERMKGTITAGDVFYVQPSTCVTLNSVSDDFSVFRAYEP